MNLDSKWLHYFMVVLLLSATMLAVGCNTMEGAGKDVEAAGEAVQDAAN